MKKSIENIKKQRYELPTVEKIVIDNDISLQLASNPPFGPDETLNLQMKNSSDPMKIYII